MLFLKSLLEKSRFLKKNLQLTKNNKKLPIRQRAKYRTEKKCRSSSADSALGLTDLSCQGHSDAICFGFFCCVFSCPGSILFHLGQIKKNVSQALPHLFLFFSDLNKKSGLICRGVEIVKFSTSTSRDK